MDFKQLNYIVTIAKEQNITHAAEKLYITRSALNYCLLNLEKELGFQLFKRLPNKLIPTPAGEIYLEKATQILTNYHELKHVMAEYSDSTRGRINLGITVNGGQKQLMSVFPEFNRRYPRFSLKLAEGNVKFLENRLLNGDIDLAWFGNIPDDPLLDHITTFSNQYFNLAIAKTHPIIRQYHLEEKAGEYLDLKLFKDEMFISMNKDSFVRPIIDRYFNYAGFQPDILTYCSRMDMVSHFIIHSAAIGFLPANQKNSQLLLFRLKPDQTTDQTILFRRGHIFTEAEKYLVRLVLDMTQAEGLPG